ncbi:MULTISPECIES: LacI family DNA-binding transcriptional regulator [Oceanobacillus]|uniref:LacI family transcriptional regulator n=1 Tax=Oceanobacillus profundus TaxID=372463 RepID=A0A417YN48_9BACI|nr:LacI family DNA-binding transcriptional regulator [Oceanobacillus profundus]MCM3398684.1 LacI family transcriptional regulator [Oceanobacillus profundus]RHW35117.1 LacI family transcriptional regulator [Oceanobacillus profundus]
MITIKDIAEMANVSRSTVSRVLNDSGYVSEDARKRVESVVKETGYAPSEYAKSLRTKKTKVIGVILPTIQTETPSRIVTGLGRELSKHGYQILLANTDHDKEKELEYLDLLKVRQVDGIVLIATNADAKLMKKIKEINIPIVVIGQEAEDVIHVTYDDYRAVRELTRLFIQKGHEKIAFIGVDESDRAVGYYRKKGFLDEMAAQGLSVEKTWVQKAIFDIASGHEAMGEILKYANKPTATIAVTDRLAIGAMSYLKEQGLEIPTDMAIAGIGASEMSQYMEPPLTTVDYQNEKAGEEGAKQILASIESRPFQEKLVMDYRLIIRGSV